MKKRQIKYNIENLKSRIPGLFTFIEDGKIYEASSSPQGCYDKYVCNLRITKGDKINIPLIQEDNFGNLQYESVSVDGIIRHSINIPIFVDKKYILKSHNEEEKLIYYSYRTIIDIYHKYKVVKEIKKQKYYKRWETSDYNAKKIKTNIETICKFIDFIDRGIGLYDIEDLVTSYNTQPDIANIKEKQISFDYDECYLIPSKIYISTAYNTLEEMRILKKSCEFYDKIQDNSEKIKYNEFCCTCQKFKLMGGENMISLLEYCFTLAEEISKEYYNYTDRKNDFCITTPLLSTTCEMGVFNQYRPIWEGGRVYHKGEIVYYNGDTYICLTETNGKYNEDKDVIEFPDDDFKKINEFNTTIKSYKYDDYYNEEIELKNIKGGYEYDLNGEIVLNGKTSSRLRSLRRFKTFLKDGVEQKPPLDKDWLFYYKKGVIHKTQLSDKYGNIEEIAQNPSETKEEIDKKNYYYVYGDVITSINHSGLKYQIKDDEGNVKKYEQDSNGDYYYKTYIPCDKDGYVYEVNEKGERYQLKDAEGEVKEYEQDSEGNYYYIEGNTSCDKDGYVYAVNEKGEKYKLTDDEGNVKDYIQDSDGNFYYTENNELCDKDGYVYKLSKDGKKYQLTDDEGKVKEIYYNTHDYYYIDENNEYKNIICDTDGYVYDINNNKSLIFEYSIGAHLSINDIKSFTDEDGNIIYNYKNFEIDKDSVNGKYHGIHFTEKYDIAVESELDDLIQGKDYFLLPKSFKRVINGEEINLDILKEYTVNNKKRYKIIEDNNKDFYRCYYSFDDYIDKGEMVYEYTVDGEIVDGDEPNVIKIKIPDNKQYEFSVLNNIVTNPIDTDKGKFVYSDIASDYTTNIDKRVDFEYNNLYKEDYLVGIHYQPYVQVDVNIDRGNGDAFESFYKLMEIKTMQDLENYQNGGFFKLEKLN